MSTSTPLVVAKPPFGGLKRAKVRLLPYDLGNRQGKILVRVLYWTHYSREQGWQATLYNDSGQVVRESVYTSSESEALQDVLLRFVRLRDAPYMFLRDLFETLAGGERSTLRFTVYSSKYTRLTPKMVQKPLRRSRYTGGRRDIDGDELRPQKIPQSLQYARLSAQQLIGMLSEYRLVDLFHRETWSVGERPAWFSGIRFSAAAEDALGVDLWVASNDGLPDIPIQVTSSGAARMWKFANQRMYESVDAPPVIVAGETVSDNQIFEQLMHGCEVYRLMQSRRSFLKTA